MYKFLSFLLFIFFININTSANNDTTWVINSIIEVPNTSKEDIYEKAKIFIAKKFNSSKDIIQFDKQNNRIVIKSFSQYEKNNWSNSQIGGIVSFSIDIEFKDNKYRIIIDNFHHNKLKNNDIELGDFENEKSIFPYTKKQWNSFKIKVYNEFVLFSKSLESYIKKSKKNNDW